MKELTYFEKIQFVNMTKAEKFVYESFINLEQRLISERENVHLTYLAYNEVAEKYKNLVSEKYFDFYMNKCPNEVREELRNLTEPFAYVLENALLENSFKVREEMSKNLKYVNSLDKTAYKNYFLKQKASLAKARIEFDIFKDNPFFLNHFMSNYEMNVQRDNKGEVIIDNDSLEPKLIIPNNICDLLVQKQAPSEYGYRQLSSENE